MKLREVRELLFAHGVTKEVAERGIEQMRQRLADELPTSKRIFVFIQEWELVEVKDVLQAKGLVTAVNDLRVKLSDELLSALSPPTYCSEGHCTNKGPFVEIDGEWLCEPCAEYWATLTDDEEERWEH